MRIDLARLGPADLAARLRSERSVQPIASEQMHAEVKSAGRRAPHLICGNGSQAVGAITGLLQELAPRGVLETLVAFDVPAREEPCARERTGGLFHDQDPANFIDAGDDRADAWAVPPRPLGHES